MPDTSRNLSYFKLGGITLGVSFIMVNWGFHFRDYFIAELIGFLGIAGLIIAAVLIGIGYRKRS
jgi:hypothetical protein